MPDGLLALGLGVLAFVHRALFLVGSEDRRWPFSVFYFGDTRVFYEHALALLRGLPFDGGVPLRPPLFPVLLSLVYRVSGADIGRGVVSHMTVRLILAAVASVGVGLFFLLARPYLGRLGAVAATLPCVWSFAGLVLAVAPVVEGTYLTVLSGVLLAWTRWVPSPCSAPPGRDRGLRGALAVGFGLGVLNLLRAETMVLGGAVLALTAIGGRRAVLRASWVAIGWGLALVPSTALHHEQLTRANTSMHLAEPLPVWAPVSIYGELNLALANAPGADGRFSPVPLERLGARGSLDLENPRQLEMVLHGSTMVLGWVREDPLRIARLMGAKLALAGRVVRLGWTARNWPGGLVGTREPIDLFTPERATARWIWAPLVLLGIVALARSGRSGRTWLAVVGVASLAPLAAIVLFYGYARIAAIALPFWLSLAGIGAVSPIVGFRLPRPDRSVSGDGRRRRVAWGLAAIGAAILAVDVWAATHPIQLVASGSSDRPGGSLVQDDRVRLEPKPRS